MRYVIITMLFAVSSILSGCVSTEGVLTEEQAIGIPDNAGVLIAKTEKDPEKLFDQVHQYLLREGYRIETSNKEVLNLTTEGKDIGESTLTRFNFLIEPAEEGSRLIGRADWRPGTAANTMGSVMAGVSINTEWERATWSTGRPKRAFGALVKTAKNIEHSVISYEITN